MLSTQQFTLMLLNNHRKTSKEMLIALEKSLLCKYIVVITCTSWQRLPFRQSIDGNETFHKSKTNPRRFTSLNACSNSKCLLSTEKSVPSRYFGNLFECYCWKHHFKAVIWKIRTCKKRKQNVHLSQNVSTVLLCISNLYIK